MRIVHISIPDELHKEMKIAVAKSGMTLVGFVTKAIKHEVKAVKEKENE